MPHDSPLGTSEAGSMGHVSYLGAAGVEFTNVPNYEVYMWEESIMN